MTLSQHEIEVADASGAFDLADRLPPGYLDAVLGERVRSGLTAWPKTLPSSLFYDERGDSLFLAITELGEYYQTRAERQILGLRAAEIARATRAATVVELGAGAAEKTRRLLDALTAVGTLRCYAPLDVSRTSLVDAGRALVLDYPGLLVSATLADFETDFTLAATPAPRVAAFLGGTLGNLDTGGRSALYARVRSIPADALLIGVDLVKDPRVLTAAYDDSLGVTAQFNRNALAVLNRRFAATFQPGAFDHLAVWNPEHERIEMWLRARVEHKVELAGLGLSVHFERGESVRTEICVKFRRAQLTAELAAAGFTVRRWWTDDSGYYALLLATANQA